MILFFDNGKDKCAPYLKNARKNFKKEKFNNEKYRGMVCLKIKENINNELIFGDVITTPKKKWYHKSNNSHSDFEPVFVVVVTKIFI